MSNLTEAAAGNGAGSGRYAIVGYRFRMPGGIYTAGDFWQLLSRRGFIREPVAIATGPATSRSWMTLGRAASRPATRG